MFLVHVALLLLMATVVIWWASNLLISLVYGIPRAFELCYKRICSWRLLLVYVGAVVFWLCIPTVLFIAVGYSLAAYRPTWLDFVLGSWGLLVGQFTGLSVFLLSLFRRATRDTIRGEFENTAIRYLVTPKTGE